MSRTLPTVLAVLSLATPLLAHPLFGQKSAYETTPPQHKARVSILATSTSIHQNFAGNQDTYLADLSFKEGDTQLARLIDQYPSSANPIQRTLLVDRRQFQMALIRTPRCDAPAKDFLLYQGDANVYDASARATLATDPTTIIPCYKIVHTKTTLIKRK